METNSRYIGFTTEFDSMNLSNGGSTAIWRTGFYCTGYFFADAVPKPLNTINDSNTAVIGHIDKISDGKINNA